jgi:hypothetical protein
LPYQAELADVEAVALSSALSCCLHLLDH